MTREHELFERMREMGQALTRKAIESQISDVGTLVQLYNILDGDVAALDLAGRIGKLPGGSSASAEQRTRKADPPGSLYSAPGAMPARDEVAKAMDAAAEAHDRALENVTTSACFTTAQRARTLAVADAMLGLFANARPAQVTVTEAMRAAIKALHISIHAKSECAEVRIVGDGWGIAQNFIDVSHMTLDSLVQLETRLRLARTELSQLDAGTHVMVEKGLHDKSCSAMDEAVRKIDALLKERDTARAALAEAEKSIEAQDAARLVQAEHLQKLTAQLRAQRQTVDVEALTNDICDAQAECVNNWLGRNATEQIIREHLGAGNEKEGAGSTEGRAAAGSDPYPDRALATDTSRPERATLCGEVLASGSLPDRGKASCPPEAGIKPGPASSPLVPLVVGELYCVYLRCVCGVQRESAVTMWQSPSGPNQSDWLQFAREAQALLERHTRP